MGTAGGSPLDPLAHGLGASADVVAEVRDRVISAILRRPSDCVLLSGGLDTSILAPFAAQSGTREAVTVVTSLEAPDRPFAEAIARELGWTHDLHVAALEDLLGEVEFVVRELRTFDPMEIRNSIVIARALRVAQRHGYSRAMTGDAADELFGGYSFMMAKPEAEFVAATRAMARTMRFSSVPLGRALGVEVRAPYTDPEVIDLALRLPKGSCVVEYGGVRIGKFVLRQAFPESMSRWRRKDPIEVGSGTTILPEWFAARTSERGLADERVRILRDDQVSIRDAEHLAYYRTFQSVFGGSPPLSRFAGDYCRRCGYELADPESAFCRTCGAYPCR